MGGHATVGPVRMYYETAGQQGHPLVLLHVAIGGAVSWQRQIEALSARYRLFVPEQRGRARTADVPGPISYQAMTDDTLGFIESVVGEPVYLVGARSKVASRDENPYRMDESEWLAKRFQQHRTRLRAVAYRMLGSVSDADDAVQEAWLRLIRSDTNEIRDLEGWLITVKARVCLDQLRKMRSKHCDQGKRHPMAGLWSGSGASDVRRGETLTVCASPTNHVSECRLPFASGPRSLVPSRQRTSTYETSTALFP